MSPRRSILCPNCRKLISVDEEKCPYCGLVSPGSFWKKNILGRLSSGQVDAVKLIISLNIAYFILSLLLNPLTHQVMTNPLAFFSPSENSLFLLGASGTIPIAGYGRWWTLISASFLHGGILHILFNMMALWQMGYFVLREYGLSRFVIIYVLTGVGGFYLSYLAGIPFTIGASASICGLIGSIIYYGKSRGGSYGEIIYKQAMGWVLGLAVFGFVIPGINNWAHGGGLLSGILISLLVGYQEKREERFLYKIIAAICIILTFAVLLWGMIQTILILIQHL
jgi:rhomboid protease GluP